MRAHAIERPDAGTLLTTIAPAIAIGLAGLAARTPLAAAYPRLSVLLFLWIAADGLTLALIARAPGHRPSRHAVLAALAGACVAVGVASSDRLRAALLTMPVIVALMGVVVGVHLGWGLARAWRTWRAGPAGPARWAAAAGEIMPPALIRIAAAELSLIRLALFRWGSAPDVPAGSRGFDYHRHLLPIFAVVLGLQAIELMVVHLLVSRWSATAAWVLFAISTAGLIYMVGLLKSFRLKPVLLTAEGVRVRTGILIDRFIPYDQIVSLDASFGGAEVKQSGTLNAALLAWPNLLLRLRDPIPRARLLRRATPITAVALRLDDPEPFARVLRWRLGQASRAGEG